MVVVVVVVEPKRRRKEAFPVFLSGAGYTSEIRDLVESGQREAGHEGVAINGGGGGWWCDGRLVEIQRSQQPWSWNHRSQSSAY